MMITDKQNPGSSGTENGQPPSSSSSSAAATATTNRMTVEEEFRQMASVLVDNLLAKAIVKASQELAFTNSHNQTVHGRRMSGLSATSPPPLLQQPLPQTKPSDTNNNDSGDRSSSTTTNTSGSSSTSTDTTPTISSGGITQHSLDINGNAPEIQIDLVGPRTPSPVEESSFELPAVQPRQYKFKVDNDGSAGNTDTDGGDHRSDSDVEDKQQEPARPPSPPAAASASKPKTIQFMAAAKTHLPQVVDVATTPEMEQMDLEQVHELSKHIVADIINQAVRRLNIDLKTSHQQQQQQQQQQKHQQQHQQHQMKHEPESTLSQTSHYSSLQGQQSQNNCSWLTRTRQALRRIMRHACICDQAKRDTDATSGGGGRNRRQPTPQPPPPTPQPKQKKQPRQRSSSSSS